MANRGNEIETQVNKATGKTAGKAAGKAPLALYRCGAPEFPSTEFVALVPGAEVPLLPLDLPVGLTGAAREKVARRRLRDSLGPAAETVEIRPYGPVNGSQSWTAVLLADKARLADWRKDLANADACRALLPDYLALPAAPDLWVLSCTGAQFSARLGPDDGFSAEPELALFLLEQALNSPPKALLCLKEAGPEQAELAEFCRRHELPMLTAAPEAAEIAAQLADLGLRRPQQFTHGELDFDLRRDPEAALDRLRRQILPWRLPVLMGLLAAALWSASMILDIRRLTAEAAQSKAATEALVRQNFVPSGPILDVQRQVAAALATRQAQVATPVTDPDPLALLQRAADVLRAADAMGAVSRATYQAGVGLSLALDLADFAALEALIAALKVADLQVKLGESGSREGAGVTALLTLTWPEERR